MPRKSLADHMGIVLSPVLIMLLVGSLCFFLVQVFYRGEAVDAVRWVLFWFVMAVVLVSRMGIEQGAGHATAYGLALAAATWLYLVRVHPAYLVGVALLGVVWWSANRLTLDCTLIADDEDASGEGLLQKTALTQKPANKKPRASGGVDKKRGRAPHRPGG